MLRLEASNLSAQRGCVHGFFGRTGGVSAGIYQSLNCGPGSGDDRSHVLENRHRVREALGGKVRQLVTLYQVHSADGIDVNAPWEIGDAPKADAMATNQPGIGLGILTADCAPVLLADAEAGVIGAAHTGWKGALAGVVERAIVRMEELGASRGRIAAAIGPCISQTAYEVSDEFRTNFIGHDVTNARFFVPAARSLHWQFDLPGFVHARLQVGGIHNTTVLARCTYADPGNFYSFRRTTHRGEGDYGRQISSIALL